MSKVSNEAEIMKTVQQLKRLSVIAVGFSLVMLLSIPSMAEDDEPKLRLGNGIEVDAGGKEASYPARSSTFASVPFDVVQRDLSELEYTFNRFGPLPLDKPFYRPDVFINDVEEQTAVGKTVTIEHRFAVSFGEIQDNPADAVFSEFMSWLSENPHTFCFVFCSGESDYNYDAVDDVAVDDVYEAPSVIDSKEALGLSSFTEQNDARETVKLEDTAPGAHTFRFEDPGLLYVCLVQTMDGRPIPEARGQAYFWERFSDAYCMKGVIGLESKTDFKRQQAYKAQFKLRANNPTSGPVDLSVHVVVYGEEGGLLYDEWTYHQGSSKSVVTRVINK